MSKMKEIDLGTLSQEHLDNVQDVYALMAFLLDDQSDFTNLGEKELELIHLASQNIKVRDGVLKYFSDAPFNIRVDIMKSFTLISDAMLEAELDAEAIGYSTMLLAAFMLCHAGIHEDFDEDRDVNYELELVDNLLKEAETLGCEASLLQLLQMARRHDVPPVVFYQSLANVSFEDCTKPGAAI